MTNVNQINIDGKTVSGKTARVRTRRAKNTTTDVPGEYITSRVKPPRRAERYKNNPERRPAITAAKRALLEQEERLKNDPEHRAIHEAQQADEQELRERGHQIYERRLAKTARRREDAVLPPEELAKVRKARKAASERLRRSKAWYDSANMPKAYALVVREFISRCLRDMMAPTAYTLMMFVFDRTLDWGKQWETITTNQFLYGSKTRDDGTRAFCGMCISERTLRNAINEMEEMGFLEVETLDTGRRRFAIPDLATLYQNACRLIDRPMLGYKMYCPRQDEFVIL